MERCTLLLVVHFLKVTMRRKIKHYLQQIKIGRLRQMFYQLKWIYKYSRKNILAIIIYTLIGLSGTVVSLFCSLVSKDLVDIVTGHNTGELLTTFCWLIGSQLGSNLMSQLSCYVPTKISMKVDNSIKADIFDQIMISDWESLSQFHSGVLLTRWSSDVSSVSIGVLNLAPNLIIYLFRFISALIMVVHYDASFAIFALISVPFSFFTSRGSMRRMKKSSMNSLSVNAKMSSFNQEAFSNIQTVKAFDLVSLYSKKLRNLQKEFTDVRLRYQKISSINTIILSVVAMAVTYSTYGWGIYKVWIGTKLHFTHECSKKINGYCRLT